MSAQPTAKDRERARAFWLKMTALASSLLTLRAFRPLGLEQSLVAISTATVTPSDFALTFPLSETTALDNREALRDAFQDSFDEAARNLAARLASTADAEAWFDGFSSIIVSHYVGQTMLGAERALLPSELLDAARVLSDEFTYAESFALDIDDALADERPLSEEAVAARSILYGGRGRAAWFKADERRASLGIVVDYFSTDDDGTCEPCLDAENRSPFLPGRGVFPGEACRGRGRCRCVRVPRIDFEAFTRLSNRAALEVEFGLTQ